MAKHKGRKQRRAIWTDPVGQTKKSTAAFHGLEVVQVEHMRKKQGNTCAICQDPLGKNQVIDHDHELARLHGHPEVHGCRFCVRAILCVRCNNLLGLAKDSPAILLRAMAYVKLARKIHNGEVTAGDSAVLEDDPSVDHEPVDVEDIP